MTSPPLTQGSRASGCGDSVEAGRRSSTMPYTYDSAQTVAAKVSWELH
jgi:hypothetical protein